jgi:hypothetical protein
MGAKLVLSLDTKLDTSMYQCAAFGYDLTDNQKTAFSHRAVKIDRQRSCPCPCRIIEHSEGSVRGNLICQSGDVASEQLSTEAEEFGIDVPRRLNFAGLLFFHARRPQYLNNPWLCDRSSNNRRDAFLPLRHCTTLPS